MALPSIGTTKPTFSKTRTFGAWVGRKYGGPARPSCKATYQPLAWILLETEYLAWGLNPKGYHLASLALHAINAVLFYFLIRTLVSRSLPEIQAGRSWAISLTSGLAAALFAVHPLRVEVVAWASCQPYLPCAGFSLMAVLTYLRGWQDNRRRLAWLSASVVLFAAALGSKAVPVGLPLVLVILDFSVLNRSGAGRSVLRVSVEKLPYVVLATAVALIAVRAKTDPPRLTDYRPGPAQFDRRTRCRGRVRAGLLSSEDGLAERLVGLQLSA